MFVEKSNDFTPTPAGVHKAVCNRFVDLGTHEDNGQFGLRTRREIMISWLIPAERIEIDGKDLPLIHNQYFTWSMHEKANLRKSLESWRGRPFGERDFAGPPDGFDTKKLIGVGCQLQIMHNENGKAKLTAILPLTKDDWPQIEGQTTYFQMQTLPLDMDAFGRLSKFHQEKIKSSPEWAKANGDIGNEGYDDGRDRMPDDEIPF